MFSILYFSTTNINEYKTIFYEIKIKSEMSTLIFWLMINIIQIYSLYFVF